MIDRKMVIKGLVEAIRTITAYVPERYWGYADQACRDAITLLQADQAQLVELRKLLETIADDAKEDEAIINQYHRADAFLAAHGWRWDDETD